MVLLPGVLLVVTVAWGAYLYESQSGLLVILGGAVAIVSAAALLRWTAWVLALGQRAANAMNNLIVVAASLGITLLVVEAGLTWWAKAKPLHSAGTDQSGETAPLTVPNEWKQRPVAIEGAPRAMYWYGKLHVYNNDNFRNVGDYRIEEGKRRIVVLGDSLTYGRGIAAQDTYSAVLERMWRLQEPNVRVYNLGQEGAQSEDVVRIAKKWLPILKPERVIYGICLNDFLPSGVGQYQNNMAWQIPIPKQIKVPFEFRTDLGAFLTDRYNRALMTLGIRDDFYADILKNFRDYQKRFRRDMVELNRLVLQETGKPVVAMVLDQYPGSEQGYRISRIAEGLARAAEMEVVSTQKYYETYGKTTQQLHVSQLEGHPNEFANRLFAEMLAGHLSF